MWPFGKKTSQGKQPLPGGRNPAERVISLSSQGYSEPEIIKAMKQEGFSPVEVDRGMKEALRSITSRPPVPSAAGHSAPGQPPPSYPGDLNSRHLEPLDMPGRPPKFSDEEEEFSPSQEPMKMTGPPKEFAGFDKPGALPLRRGPAPPREESGDEMDNLPDDMGDEDDLSPIPKLRIKSTKEKAREERWRALEELTETIVEEKWDDFKHRMTEFQGRFDQVARKLQSLEEKINHLEGEKQDEMKHIEEKIDTYRSSLSEMSSRIESMENVVKNSLNPVLQTLRSMSEALKEMKEEEKGKK